MSDNLRKSSGPFIGPRGGKWADSKHTIPYKEQGTHHVADGGGGFREVKTHHEAGHYAVHEVQPSSNELAVAVLKRKKPKREFSVTHKPSGLSLGQHSERKAKNLADHMHEHAGDAGGSAKFGVNPSGAEARRLHEAYKKFGKSMDDNPDLMKSSGPFIGPRGGKWANSQHTIPYVEQKHAGKPAPKHREHDEHGANEIHLVADNTYEHHGQKESIHANLAKKIAAGTYDHAQAGKLFEHLANSVSKKYQKDHGSGGGAHAFDVPTRRAAARAMADQFHDEVKDGYHDHHVESGVHAKRAKAGGGIAAMASAHGSKPKGKEIGRTKSGMAIHASESASDFHAHHNDMSHAEHREAEAFHREAGEKERQGGAFQVGGKREQLRAHTHAANAHANAAQSKHHSFSPEQRAALKEDAGKAAELAHAARSGVKKSVPTNLDYDADLLKFYS